MGKQVLRVMTFKNISVPATLLTVALLAGCQTSSPSSVLSSVLPGNKNDSQSQTTTAEDSALKTGQNPNAANRLKNTRTALSDYCPALRIRAGTETYRTYPKGADREQTDNIQHQATITRVARECNYVGQNLEIKVGARGRVITGPTGKPGDVVMPIRVAVQEGSCSRHFKLYQQVAIIGPGQTSTGFQFVDDTIVIPAPKATNIRMYIGFDEGPYNDTSTQPCTS